MKYIFALMLTLFLFADSLGARSIEQYFLVAEFDHVTTDTKEIVFKHPKLNPAKIEPMPFKVNSYVRKNLELGFLPVKLSLLNNKDVKTLLNLKGKEWIFARFKPGKKDKFYLDEMKAFSSLDKLIKNPAINKKYPVGYLNLEKHIKKGIRVFRVKMKVKGQIASKK